jgi:hypothetical protein
MLEGFVVEEGPQNVVAAAVAVAVAVIVGLLSG